MHVNSKMAHMKTRKKENLDAFYTCDNSCGDMKRDSPILSEQEEVKQFCLALIQTVSQTPPISVLLL